MSAAWPTWYDAEKAGYPYVVLIHGYAYENEIAFSSSAREALELRDRLIEEGLPSMTICEVIEHPRVDLGDRGTVEWEDLPV